MNWRKTGKDRERDGERQREREIESERERELKRGDRKTKASKHRYTPIKTSMAVRTTN